MIAAAASELRSLAEFAADCGVTHAMAAALVAGADDAVASIVQARNLLATRVRLAHVEIVEIKEAGGTDPAGNERQRSRVS